MTYSHIEFFFGKKKPGLTENKVLFFAIYYPDDICPNEMKKEMSCLAKVLQQTFTTSDFERSG